VTVVVRKAYGGAYDVMSSKHIRGDIQLRLALRGDRGHGTPRRRGHHLQERDQSGRGPGQKRAELIADYTAKFASPYQAAQHGYVD